MNEKTLQRNKRVIFSIVALVGSLMLMVMLFLPFASATETYRGYLEANPDVMYASEIGMTNGDAVDVSLFEFARMYLAAAGMGMSTGIAITCFVIIAVFALFAILTTLFSVLRKPIPIIIFNILSLAVFMLLKWDFEDRGVIPNSNYDWGVAQVFCYISAVVIMVGAILLLIEKIKLKKQIKSLNN